VVTLSNPAKPPKLRCLCSIDIGSIPQPARYIPVSFSSSAKQSGVAVRLGAKFISDALAALDPEFESISSPAV
jgi:hypothetical protein